jgi:tRNA pseudouridine55 synthase
VSVATEAPEPTSSKRPRTDRAGLLAIDKPSGLTSHGVVERVARRLRLTAAGHLGTLDPEATGLLLVATGPATRCARAWQGGDKTYEGAIRFGVRTTTQDVHGEVLEERPVRWDESRVVERSRAFVGELMQRPPMVSAVRQGGRRLYELARRGIEVERVERPVVVRRWDWLGFDPPVARFRIVCGPGTYVRTLAHDLGEALGWGGALETLRRLRSEPFGLERSVTLRDVDALDPDEVWARAGMPLEQALAHRPMLVLDTAAVDDIGFGRRPTISDDASSGLPLDAGTDSIVLASSEGTVIGLGELVRLEGGRLEVRPRVVLPWAVRQGPPR